MEKFLSGAAWLILIAGVVLAILPLVWLINTYPIGALYALAGVGIVVAIFLIFWSVWWLFGRLN